MGRIGVAVEGIAGRAGGDARYHAAVPRRIGRVCAALLAALMVAPVSVGRSQGIGQYRVNDYGTPELVRNIMPAGQGANVTVAQTAQEQLQPDYLPPHLHDQAPLYDAATLLPPGQVSDSQLQQLTKEESFGVADDQIASVETPRPGVTIIRDKAWGVPHIFGASREDAKFGAGYVTAEDRLFQIDVLRHAGRGNLASLIGSSGFASDCTTHYGTGYDPAEEARQVAQLPAIGQEDLRSFSAGVNAFVHDPGNANRMPVEYTVFPPFADWSPEDTLVVAGLIGANLGFGGGSEASNTLAFEQLTRTYGAAAARRIFDDFHAADDPESPTTIDAPFPYEARGHADPASVALIDKPAADPGGCTHTPGPSGAAPASSGQAAMPRARAARHALDIVSAVRSGFPHHMSNALVVGADRSVDGHPLAVFGSQAAYWSPEIYMEMDVHAPATADTPGWDARGFQFPGTGVLVEIGRGQDFAWSATSAGGDNVDQRVERLCNPNSANPLQNVDTGSTHYWYKGRCLPMVEKTLSYPVPPSPGSPPGSGPSSLPFVGVETFKVERAVHDDGIAVIQGRTTVTSNGVAVPVAVSSQRTNFLRELDQAVGFDQWNTPSAVHDAASFIAAAAHIDDTFNWLYVDDHDIAYYQSGLLPARNPGADPDLLTWGTGEWDWQGMLPADQHPHAINPARGWMTSWNNRPAPHFGAADSNWNYGPLYRNQMLDQGLRHAFAAGGGKTTLTGVFAAMQAASVEDFRARQLLGYIFDVIGDPAPLSPAEQSALAALRSWHADGDNRQDRSKSGAYAHADAISIFDSFYPHAIHTIYGGWLTSNLGGFPKTLDNPPNDAHRYGSYSGYNVGSAFDGGWMDAIDKDLRQVLGRPVTLPHSHLYCGGAEATEGSLPGCRTVLLAALDTAIQDHQTDYRKLTADDRLDYRPLGLQALPTSPWTNRPTQQQVVEFTSHRPRAQAAAVATLPNTGAAPTPALLPLVALLLLTRVVRRRQRR